jgi:hypothetical protein
LICPLPKDLPDAGRWKKLKAIGIAINNTQRGEQGDCTLSHYLNSTWVR